MSESIKKLINDYPAARWSALILVALMMFFAYMFVDVMSPLKSLVESSRGWDSSVFGTYAASEYILNVFGFLIVAGIILDKMGTRFTGLLSASLMVIGASVKYVGITEWFQATDFNAWLGSWWTALPGSAKMASLGFMIFGCGCEMAGTTVSKTIAKWFQGKETYDFQFFQPVYCSSYRILYSFAPYRTDLLLCIYSNGQEAGQPVSSRWSYVRRKVFG